MPVKILHVITQLELGGAQKHVLDLLGGLDPVSFEAHLISSAGLLEGDARRIPHLKVTLWSFLVRPPHLWRDLQALASFYFFIKRNKFSIVHTHSSKAGILARWAAHWAGVPAVVHTVHGWGFHDFDRSFLNGLYIFLERMTAKITTRLITVSVADREKGLANRIGEPSQYALIRCGIGDDVSMAPPEKVRELEQALGRRPQDRFVGMVACLKPQKNPLDFVKAAALLREKDPSLRFILAGDGILRPGLEREIRAQGLEEVFFLLGWQKDIRPVLAILSVLVLTSLWEGLPVVFLEAMRYAKPIVAYDVCGVHEIVKEGVNGHLVAPGDVDGLVRRVAALMEDGERRERMGALGQRIAAQEAFSSAGSRRRLLKVYQECLEVLRKGG